MNNSPSGENIAKNLYTLNHDIIWPALGTVKRPLKTDSWHHLPIWRPARAPHYGSTTKAAHTSLYIWTTIFKRKNKKQVVNRDLMTVAVLYLTAGNFICCKWEIYFNTVTEACVMKCLITRRHSRTLHRSQNNLICLKNYSPSWFSRLIFPSQAPAAVERM